MAEEPRGFCLPVPLVTTPEDQSAPLRGLGEGHFEGHEALGGEGGPPCACIAWGRTSTDIRSWLDHPQRWRATFFFFFLVVSGTSPERSLLAPVSEQSAGRSGLRDQLVPAILSARPALPGPPAAPLAPRPEALPGTVPCVCGNCPLRALLPFSFSFALLEAGRVLPFCRSGDCHRVRPHDDAHPCGPFPHLQDGGWGGGASRTVASVLAGP